MKQKDIHPSLDALDASIELRNMGQLERLSAEIDWTQVRDHSLIKQFMLPKQRNGETARSFRKFAAQALDILVGNGYRIMEDENLSEILTEDPRLVKTIAQTLKDHPSTQDSGYTLIHFAVSAGIPFVDALRYAAIPGADINAQDEQGNTAFHYLWTNDLGAETDKDRGHQWLKSMVLLIEQGADPTLINHEGRSGLDEMEAAINGEDGVALIRTEIRQAYKQAQRARAIKTGAAGAVTQGRCESTDMSTDMVNIPLDLAGIDNAGIEMLSNRLHWLECQDLALAIRQWFLENPDWQGDFTIDFTEIDLNACGAIDHGMGLDEEQQEMLTEFAQSLSDNHFSFRNIAFAQEIARRLNDFNWQRDQVDQALCEAMETEFGADGRAWLANANASYEELGQGSQERRYRDHQLPLYIGHTQQINGSLARARDHIEELMAKNMSLQILKWFDDRPGWDLPLNICYTDIEHDIEPKIQDWPGRQPTNDEHQQVLELVGMLNGHDRRANRIFCAFGDNLMNELQQTQWGPESIRHRINATMKMIGVGADWVDRIEAGALQARLDTDTPSMSTPQERKGLRL